MTLRESPWPHSQYSLPQGRPLGPPVNGRGQVVTEKPSVQAPQNEVKPVEPEPPEWMQQLVGSIADIGFSIRNAIVRPEIKEYEFAKSTDAPIVYPRFLSKDAILVADPEIFDYIYGCTQKGTMNPDLIRHFFGDQGRAPLRHAIQKLINYMHDAQQTVLDTLTFEDRLDEDRAKEIVQKGMNAAMEGITLARPILHASEFIRYSEFTSDMAMNIPIGAYTDATGRQRPYEYDLETYSAEDGSLLIPSHISVVAKDRDRNAFIELLMKGTDAVDTYPNDRRHRFQMAVIAPVDRLGELERQYSDLPTWANEYTVNALTDMAVERRQLLYLQELTKQVPPPDAGIIDARPHQFVIIEDPDALIAAADAQSATQDHIDFYGAPLDARTILREAVVHLDPRIHIIVLSAKDSEFMQELRQHCPIQLFGEMRGENGEPSTEPITQDNMPYQLSMQLPEGIVDLMLPIIAE